MTTTPTDILGLSSAPELNSTEVEQQTPVSLKQSITSDQAALNQSILDSKYTPHLLVTDHPTSTLTKSITNSLAKSLAGTGMVISLDAEDYANNALPVTEVSEIAVGSPADFLINPSSESTNPPQGSGDLTAEPLLATILQESTPKIPPRQQRVLITGGLGYIGSHCAWTLADAGYQVIILDRQPLGTVSDSLEGLSEKSVGVKDNSGSEKETPQITRIKLDLDSDLHTEQKPLHHNHRVKATSSLDSEYPLSSYPLVFRKIRKLLPPEKRQNICYVSVDLNDRQALEELFQEQRDAGTPIDAVIHLAGLKSGRDSVLQPLAYYRNNLFSTINLLEVMQEFACKKFITSSSAQVYGDESPLPLSENSSLPTRAHNPYGQTKLTIECILDDVCRSSDLQVVKLRYFNPIGAHPSGLLGEELPPSGQNIFAIISEVYLGLRKEVEIFGTDYDTEDGTCERDFIHVMDVARGHLLALEYLQHQHPCQSEAINLGSGKPYSVLQILQIFNHLSDRKISYSVSERRLGDIPSLYANISKAQRLLGFTPEFQLEDMIRDYLRFIHTNYQLPPQV